MKHTNSFFLQLTCLQAFVSPLPSFEVRLKDYEPLTSAVLTSAAENGCFFSVMPKVMQPSPLETGQLAAYVLTSKEWFSHVELRYNNHRLTSVTVVLAKELDEHNYVRLRIHPKKAYYEEISDWVFRFFDLQVVSSKTSNLYDTSFIKGFAPDMKDQF